MKKTIFFFSRKIEASKLKQQRRREEEKRKMLISESPLVFCDLNAVTNVLSFAGHKPSLGLVLG